MDPVPEPYLAYVHRPPGYIQPIAPDNLKRTDSGTVDIGDVVFVRIRHEQDPTHTGDDWSTHAFYPFRMVNDGFEALSDFPKFPLVDQSPLPKGTVLPRDCLDPEEIYRKIA